jgi:uncharacterized delta-60 repeat protein
MRASRRPARLVPLLGLASLAVLVACNALNGAGDLTFGPCDGCEGAEGGSSDGPSGSDGSTDALVSDTGALDGPRADTSKEGPGGVLDTTFGTGGIVLLDPPPIDARAVGVRADGRILVVGSFSGDLAAVAFTSSGAVDMTFGTAGRIVKGSSNASFGSAIAFDSKGRALIAGTSITVATVATHYAYAVRVGASALDTTFGIGGAVHGTNANEDARGVVITPGDGAVAAIVTGNDYRFERLAENGAPDTAFGTNGVVTVANVGGDPAGLVAVTDGFVAGGTANASSSGQALGAAKVSLAGQPAGAFGVLAKASSKVGPASQVGQSIAAQSDGKLIVSGDYDPNLQLVRRVTALTRFTSTGLVDTTYGASGIASLDLTESAIARDTETTNTSVLVDASGRALAVGSVHDKLLLGGDRFRGWAARFRADGSLDPMFGSQGKLLLGTAPARIVVRGAALQPDGKLVVVGVDTNGNTLFLARIITTTTL